MKLRNIFCKGSFINVVKPEGDTTKRDEIIQMTPQLLTLESTIGRMLSLPGNYVRHVHQNLHIPKNEVRPERLEG